MYKPGARKKRLGKKRRPKIEGSEARRHDTLTQTRLRPIVNKNLFSDHFLFEILPGRMEEWKEDKKIREVFEKIKQLYARQKELLERYNEPQLEKHFIQPIFDYLGHHFEVQEAASSRRQPDYAFFPDDKTRREAHLNKGERDFYNKAVAVGDAKSWDKPLDKKTGRGAAFEDQNPSFQIDTYLRETAPRWAILTNGRCWRIYFQETSYKLNSYFEVELVDIVKKNDLESFKYFYFFFRLEAFLTDERGRNFLDQVYGGSVDYARELGEGLQENVYKALKILAEGFLGLDENKLEKNPETIKEIHSNALVLLYRMLFVLYAESRGLLDVSNETYNRTFSFNSIKQEIAENIDRGKELHSWHKQYWNRLKNLFSLINEGSESRGIPKEDLFIPPYNGSLFNPSKHEFLERCAVGDRYLAEVINLLSRSNGGFIDYSTLDIRHLGSIYEGLLEFKLKIAEEDMVSIREKEKEVWVPRNEAEGKEIHEEVEEGGLYLVTDRGERKATGSYYTPGYIVKYIDGNTLGPIVKQKIEKARENGGKESEAILSINVLDPAMGSGHFLVEAVDFLARALLEAVSNDVEKGLIPEAEYSTEWAKREVVGHCIYGVDLNPLAVELAKLSLWLATIAKDKPLSFLDHRLKCGNSLIGTSLEDLPWHPKKKKQDRKQTRIDISGFVKKLVDTTKKLSEISDDTLDNIKQKEKIFGEFKETLAYDMMKTLADVRTSIYFGNEVDERSYGTYTGDAWWSSETEWKQRRNRPFAQKAREIADERKYFHWELEFPEVFFEAGKRKENPGFDAVVGNPPYGADIKGYEKDFIELLFDTETSDSAAYFLELSQKLSSGFYSMIVPKSIAFYTEWESIRKMILNRDFASCLLDVGIAFKDVNYEEIVLIISKRAVEKARTIIHKANPLKKPKISKEIILDGEVSSDLMRIADVLIFRGIPNNEEEIIRKLKRVSIPLGDIRKEVHRGIYIPDSAKATLPSGKYLFVNKVPDVQRYFIEKIWKIDISQNKKWVEKAKKIMVPRIFLKVLRGSRIVGFYDTGELLTTEKLVNITLRSESGYEYPFIMALVNSPLISFYIQRILFSKTTETSRVMDEPYVKVFPIRHISFTTPMNERKRLLKNAVELYRRGNTSKVLELANECLPRNKDGTFITGKEKSDVVHDILAYLANQMIEMNKQKLEETKGFLSWLEREIGIPIDGLSNKTIIKEFHENTFDKLIEILKKNKKKLSIDPHRREFQEKLNVEFHKSMAKLTPLKAKIQTTDKLIDQIVYSLYGLTDEEIEIVESSFRQRGSLEGEENKRVGS